MKPKYRHKGSPGKPGNISASRSKTPSSRRSSQININISESHFPKKKNSRNNFSSSTASNYHYGGERLTPGFKGGN